MNIKPFAVEEWMNAYETGARYNIAETCVDSISLDELFELSGTHKESFLNKLCARRLTYGYIEGSPDLKKGIAALYHTIRPNEIVPAHGASGANHHVFIPLSIRETRSFPSCPLTSSSTPFLPPWEQRWKSCI